MNRPTVSILHATGKSPRPTVAPRYGDGERATGGKDLLGRSVSGIHQTCGVFPDVDFIFQCSYPYKCAIDTANNVEGCCSESGLDQCTIPTTCIGLADYVPGNVEYTAYCTDSSYPYCVTLTFANSPHSPSNWGCNALSGLRGTASTSAAAPVFVSLGSSSPSSSSGKSSSSTIRTTSPTPTPIPPPSTPVGAIAGGVVGGFVAVALIFGLLVYFRRRNMDKSSATNQNSSRPSHGVPPMSSLDDIKTSMRVSEAGHVVAEAPSSNFYEGPKIHELPQGSVSRPLPELGS